MIPSALDQAKKELLGEGLDEELLKQCIVQAEGDIERAHQMYVQRRASEISPSLEDLDAREAWPMFTPLIILYTLGTIGVLGLVFGFLGEKLGWW